MVADNCNPSTHEAHLEFQPGLQRGTLSYNLKCLDRVRGAVSYYLPQQSGKASWEVSLQLGFEGQVGVVRNKSGEENEGIDPV